MKIHCIRFIFLFQVSVVQVSPTQLSVDVFSGGNHLELRAEIQVRGVHNSVDHLLLWNMKKMVVYEITSDATHLRVVGVYCQLYRVLD